MPRNRWEPKPRHRCEVSLEERFVRARHARSDAGSDGWRVTASSGRSRHRVSGRRGTGRPGSPHCPRRAPDAARRRRRLRLPGERGGARAGRSARRAHLRRQAAGLPCALAGRDQRPAGRARAPRQARTAAQGRRSLHLRPRRRRVRVPLRARRAVRGRAGRDLGERRLLLRRHPAHAPRLRGGGRVRNRAPQGRYVGPRLGGARAPAPDGGDLHGRHAAGGDLPRASRARREPDPARGGDRAGDDGSPAGRDRDAGDAARRRLRPRACSRRR